MQKQSTEETVDASRSGKKVESDTNTVAIGIDWGTTNTVSAVHIEGQPDFFNLGGDKPLIPTVVFIEYESVKQVPLPETAEEELRRFYETDKPKEVELGEGAKSRSKSPNVLFQVKLYIGLKFDSPEVQKLIESKRHPFKVVEGRDGLAAFEIDGRVHSAELIASLFLRRCRDVALVRLKPYGVTEIVDAVIGVPAYFLGPRKDAMDRAAKMAGLEMRMALTEPSAAGLHYSLNMKGKQTKMLVFDLGGGTFDVTIIEKRVDLNEYETKVIDGDSTLGGEDFTYAIEELIMEKWEAQEEGGDRAKLNPKSRANIRRSAEATKRALCGESKRQSFDCTIEGREREYVITMDEFKEKAAPLLDRLMVPIDRIRNSMPDVWAGAECILLMGGGSLNEMVQKHVEFKTNLPINDSLIASSYMMTAVGGGAATFATTLSSARLRPLIDMPQLIEVTAHDLGIQTKAGKFEVIIKRFTPIPTGKVCRSGFCFPRKPQKPSGYDEVARIMVMEGNDENARSIGERLFKRQIPAPPSQPAIHGRFANGVDPNQSITFYFEVNENARLQIEAVVDATKEKCEMVLTSSQNISIPKPLAEAPAPSTNSMSQKERLEKMKKAMGKRDAGGEGGSDSKRTKQ